MKKKGNLLIISAPSGTGKTTLVEAVLKELAPKTTRTITCTTRPPRPHEVNGKDYWFLSQNEFDKKKSRGEFLEYAKVYDHDYGTDKGSVENELQKGKDVLLVIDVQGAMALMRQKIGTFIFICPPSLEELERRIRLRKSDSDESIEKRLSIASKEMAKRIFFDYIMINDDFLVATATLKSIIVAEECRNKEKYDQI